MANWLQGLLSKSRHMMTPAGFGGSAAFLIALVYLIKSKRTQAIPEVKLSYFLRALQSNVISEVLVDGMKVFFRGYNTESWLSTNASLLTRDRLYKILRRNPEVQYHCIDSSQKRIHPADVFQLIILAGVAGYWLQKLVYERQDCQLQQSQKSQIAQQHVRFDQIYGLENAKKQLGQIIEFLCEPSKFQSIGARLRRGVMIYGPPGTGKTMLAKATATESKVTFIYSSATEFMEMYVGMGPKRVRELFAKARQCAPSIIFIDEIDSVAYKRRNSSFSSNEGGEQERISTLNQLLTEIDGFREHENIVVIAATNRVSTIDDALMRSGRFDIKIEILLPNMQDRMGILQVHLANSEGFSGADMENITNESAYLAIEHNHSTITDEDMMEAWHKLANEKQSVYLQQQQ